MIVVGKRQGGCVIAVALIATACMSVNGCSKKDPGYEIVTLQQARIEKLDAGKDGRGVITVSYYSEKHDQEIVGKGHVTKDTEIMINGALATFSDLREGDRVRGEVRVETKNGRKVQTAIRIHVERPKPKPGSDAGG